MSRVPERRAHRRFIINVIASIERADSGGVLGHVTDLSLGGIRLVCLGFEVQLQNLLRVKLDLDGTEVTMMSRLVRIKKLDGLAQELALEFVEADAKGLELLEHYLESHGEH